MKIKILMVLYMCLLSDTRTFTRCKLTYELLKTRIIIKTFLSNCKYNFIIVVYCGVKDDVTKIEKNMLRWFGNVERMDERRLTKEIYEADVGGKT
jgi:hypothetical protein